MKAQTTGAEPFDCTGQMNGRAQSRYQTRPHRPELGFLWLQLAPAYLDRGLACLRAGFGPHTALCAGVRPLAWPHRVELGPVPLCMLASGPVPSLL